MPGAAATQPTTIGLKVQEAAAYAGVSAPTIRGWIADGRLRAYRLGNRQWRVKPEDLDRMLHEERP